MVVFEERGRHQGGIGSQEEEERVIRTEWKWREKKGPLAVGVCGGGVLICHRAI